MPSYNLQEFREFIYKQVNFDALYLSWVNSGYNKMKSPSFDREDDCMPYSFDNFRRLCTWQQNKSKGHADVKNGINNKVSKAVVQMTKLGGFIAEHHSMKNAERVAGIPHSNISICCSGKLRSAGGFLWMISLGIPIHNNMPRLDAGNT